jgi:MFS family permease
MPEILTRPFILTCLAQFTFSIAFHVLLPTLPIYLSRLGSRETEIGLLVGAFAAASLVFRPLVGRALSRHSEKKVMIVGAFLFTLTFAALLLVRPFWSFLGARIFQGIAYALFNTAAFTLAVNITPETRRGQSLSYFLVSPNVALALAPFLGMTVVNRFGFTPLFIACAGLSICALFIARGVKRPQPFLPFDPLPEDRALLNRKALPPSCVVLLHNSCWGAVGAFLPLYAVGKGVSNPGVFFSAMAFTMVLGRAFGGRLLDTCDKDKIIYAILTGFIFVMVITACSETLPMFVISGLLWGTAAGFLMPTVMATTMDRVGPTARGSAVGTYTALSDFGIALGPVMAGVVIRFAGYTGMFVGLILVEILNLAYFHVFVRQRGETRSSL